MPSTKLVNSRPVVHKLSGDVHTVFPDVCKTPSPSGPVPLPYPNVGLSLMTTGGPKKVKVEGQMPMVKGAKYSTTSGDEAGSTGGVVSGKIKGEAEFTLYSFDVKFEGKNACRTGDMMTHNAKNAAG